MVNQMQMDGLVTRHEALQKMQARTMVTGLPLKEKPERKYPLYLMFTSILCMIPCPPCGLCGSIYLVHEEIKCVDLPMTGLS